MSCAVLVVLAGCVTGEQIVGPLQRVAEDHFDDEIYFSYGLVYGTTVVEMAVSEADDLHDTAGAVVMTGARRTPSVTVMADATDASDAAVFVVETVAPAPARHDSSEAAADRKRRQSELGATLDRRSVLLVQVVYNGIAPSYCDRTCMEENMWLGNSAGRSVAGLFSTATEGNLTFPRDLGAVVTVELTGSLDTATRCMYADLAVEADAALLAAGVDVRLYMHVGYYIPTSFTACTFGGTAYLSCLPYQCKFWIRQRYATNVAHELGHNLGMHHASIDADDDGVPESEYGDNSCVMGASPRWRGVSAAHRLQRGWVRGSEVVELSDLESRGSATIRLDALYGDSRDIEASSPSSIPTVLTIPRDAGGQYLVSLRGASSYDTTIPNAYKNMVTVHHVPAAAEGREVIDERSSLIRALNLGETLTLQGSIVLVVTAIAAETATVEAHWIEGTFRLPLPVPSFPATVNCSTLGWDVQYTAETGKDVCGESTLGDDKCFPKVSLNTAVLACQQVGARLCTPLELLSDATQGTGCSLDNKYIWTSESCDNGAMVAFGRTPTSDSQLVGFPTVCHEASQTEASARCCSDGALVADTTPTPAINPPQQPFSASTLTTTTVIMETAQLATAADSNPDGACQDILPSCSLYAGMGLCGSSPFMHTGCQRSCNECPDRIPPNPTEPATHTSITTTTATTPTVTTATIVIEEGGGTATASPAADDGIIGSRISAVDLSGEQNAEARADGTTKKASNDSRTSSISAIITVGVGIMAASVTVIVALLIRHKVRSNTEMANISGLSEMIYRSVTPSTAQNMNEWFTPVVTRPQLDNTGLATPQIPMELFERRQRAERARVIQRSSRCDSWISTGPGVDPAGLYGQSTPTAGAAAAVARCSAHDYQAFLYGNQAAPGGGGISDINSVDSSAGETFYGKPVGLDPAKNNQTYSRTVRSGQPAEPVYNHLHSLRNNQDYRSFVVNPAGSGRATPDGFRTPTPELAQVKYLPLATVQKAPRTVYVAAREMRAARAMHLQHDAGAESPTILPGHGRHTPV